MEQKLYKSLKQWFHLYVETFRRDVKHPGILLKIHHTVRVIRNTEKLGQSLGLSCEDILLAKTIALFHDLGRFEQLKSFNTFSDHLSVDHSRLALDILEREALMGQFSEEEKKIFTTAVFYHNKAIFPAALSERILLFVRLIRDADKLDIFRILSDHYSGRDKSNAVDIHYAVNKKISPAVLKSFLQGVAINYSAIKTNEDLKLLHLSWIYDLNFAFSLSTIQNAHYIDDILDTLKTNKRYQKVFNHVYGYLYKRIAS